MGIPTTTEAEYKRLRSYLSPYIKGPNTTAVLTALASGPASYLINNVAAVSDQLYIVSASQNFLDERLAQYGITRPPAVGLSDDIFRQLGIQVKNRKQVRDLLNNILDAIFGDQFVKATNNATFFEPYALADGDNLIINYDENNTSNIIFSSVQFQNIAAATAQEVADAITVTLRNLGQAGSAIVRNDGNGNYVELLSETIGPASSVTVLGGSAQNIFQFPAVLPAGGNASTQWTVTLQPSGLIRFTWSAGASPNLGKVNDGNYVNIFGGGFSSFDTIEGSYTIVNVVGGAVGVAYFEVDNSLITGLPQTITQGTDDAMLFFNPVKETIISNPSYAAVYQVQGKTLQVFLPATTQVVRRSREGSAHLHYPPAGTFTLNANPSSGDTFAITTTTSLIAGTDFVIGATPTITAQNIVNAITTDIPGLVALLNSTNIVSIQSDDASLTLVISYAGSQNVVASGPLGNNISLAPNQPGPYVYDTAATFTISSTNTLLAQELDGEKPRIIQVANSTGFPDASGYLVLGYGTEFQEGPIPYIARPSDDTLLLSPAYTIQNVFQPGTNVTFIDYKGPPILVQDGSDFPFYLTDVTSGRIYAQDLINSVVAAGITIVYTILYPSDIGLGKWGTIYSENPIIWGP